MDKSIIISFISVVISFLTFFFSIIIPLIKKCKLKVSLFKQLPLSLFFNQNGLSLKLRFSIHSKNKECTIEEIKISLNRTSDNKTIDFEWSLLENTFTMWAGHLANTLNSVYFARHTKINADSIEPFVIEFLNYKDSGKFYKIYINLKQIIRNEMETKNIKDINKIPAFCNECEKLKEVDDLLNKLFTYDYWQVDNYILNLHILYNSKKSIQNKFCFNITKETLPILTKNIFINNIVYDIIRDSTNDPSQKLNWGNNMRNKIINIPIYNIEEINQI